MFPLARLGLAIVVSVAPFLASADSVQASSSAKNVCAAAAPTTLQRLLGAAPEHLATDRLSATACSWHNADPSCGLRAFGLRTDTRTAEIADGAEILDLHDEAYFTLDPSSLELGAAVTIGRLDVRIGERWHQWTFTGRANARDARDMLAELAAAMPSRW